MIEIRTISAAQARAVRHAVLRPNWHIEDNIYPGDDEESTFHVGMFDGTSLVGVASVFNEPPPNEHVNTAWRLRGMAVHPPYQRKGNGGKLLEIVIAYVSEAEGTELWCNARANARTFYEEHGFKVEGQEFVLPGIGPHYLMRKEL